MSDVNQLAAACMSLQGKLDAAELKTRRLEAELAREKREHAATIKKQIAQYLQRANEAELATLKRRVRDLEALRDSFWSGKKKTTTPVDFDEGREFDFDITNTDAPNTRHHKTPPPLDTGSIVELKAECEEGDAGVYVGKMGWWSLSDDGITLIQKMKK